MPPHPAGSIELSAAEFVRVVGKAAQVEALLDLGDDIGMQALVSSKAPVITIVGKTWDLHVTEVLNVSLEENLAQTNELLRALQAELESAPSLAPAMPDEVPEADLRETVSALHDGESIGTPWAAIGAGAIEDALALDDFLGSFAGEMDCRESICRLHVSHDNPEAMQKFMEYFPLHVSDAFGRSLIEPVEGDGVLASVAYLERQQRSQLRGRIR